MPTWLLALIIVYAISFVLGLYAIKNASDDPIYGQIDRELDGLDRYGIDAPRYPVSATVPLIPGRALGA